MSNHIKFEKGPKKNISDEIELTFSISTDQKKTTKSNPKIKRNLFSADNSEDRTLPDFSELGNKSTNFSFRQFLVFSIYHLLFFLILGPFTAFLFRILFKNTILARNLSFWGKSKYFYLQTTFYLVNITAILGCALLSAKNIYMFEFYSLMGISLTRAFVIAVKYAYFSPKRIKLVYETILTKEDVKSELFVIWSIQSDEIIEKEVKDSIERNHIDNDIFQFQFMKTLQKELLPENENKSDVYSGELIAKYLIKQSKKKDFLLQNPMIPCAMISLIRAFIPWFYKAYETKGNLFGENLDTDITVICLFLGNFYFFTTNFLFIFTGIVEYDRMTKLLAKLSNLLAIETLDKYEDKKEFPTINLFCNMSFSSWFTLNRVLRDYGRRYYNRVDIHLGIFIVYYSGISLLCLLSLYHLISYQDNLMIILSGFEISMVFAGLMMLIWKGVVINDHYNIHREILIDARDIFSNLLFLGDHYFTTKEIDNEVYSIGREKIIKKLTEIRRNESLKKKFMSEKSEREEYLRKLLELTKFIQDQLTYAEDKNPFKVLGLTANKDLFQKIIAGLTTLATAVVQKLEGYFV